jgi:hypothetical protein
MLVPVSKHYGDYRRFAESLLDGLAEALATTSSLTTRLRTEVWNWKLKRVSFQQLERNKFRLDLAQVPERELELLQRARASGI